MMKLSQQRACSTVYVSFIVLQCVAISKLTSGGVSILYFLGTVTIDTALTLTQGQGHFSCEVRSLSKPTRTL